ncbi:MAG: hypothetical protein M3R43_06695 [Acidobacteriota bacterium]|nr:hypothetical protein [Acidobacteriota bacterium]
MGASDIAALRKAVEKPDASLLLLVPATQASLLVRPECLRDPVWSLRYAERVVALIHRSLPFYHWLLAGAANDAGNLEEAHAAVRDGLTLLRPAKSTDTPIAIGRLLAVELARSRKVVQATIHR